MAAEFYVPTPQDLQRALSLANERHVLSRVLQDLKPQDIFFDVGAHRGTYSCFVSQKLGKSGAVVAFEPHPANVSLLRKNLEINGGGTVLAIALSDQTGEDFLVESASSGKHRLASREQRGLAVEVRRMDELVATGAVPPPTVLKVDVEGAEVKVLRGASATLRNVRLAYVEVHPHALAGQGLGPEDVEQALSDAGLRCARIGQRGREFFIRATRSH